VLYFGLEAVRFKAGESTFTPTIVACTPVEKQQRFVKYYKKASYIWKEL
jgi:hypothetical protein